MYDTAITKITEYLVVWLQIQVVMVDPVPMRDNPQPLVDHSKSSSDQYAQYRSPRLFYKKENNVIISIS